MKQENCDVGIKVHCTCLFVNGANIMILIRNRRDGIQGWNSGKNYTCYPKYPDYPCNSDVQNHCFKFRRPKIGVIGRPSDRWTSLFFESNGFQARIPVQHRCVLFLVFLSFFLFVQLMLNQIILTRYNQHKTTNNFF